MKRRMICLVASVCVLLTLLGGCRSTGKKTKYSTYSMDYFDTVITLTGYEESQEAFDRVAEEALAQLGEYHRLYSIYHRFDGVENLCTVNGLVDGVHPTVKVDRRIIDLLLYAKEMYTLTGGVMNVAMGSVLSLWHDHRLVGRDNPSAATLPPMDRLQEAARHTDIHQVVIDEKNSTVTLLDPAMTLDVGAIAKGYAVERVALWLEEKGVTGYVLNVGGNIRTVGTKPDGELWAIGIENPDGGDYLSTLQLEGQSVVTSGSYQRFYVVDGVSYHHIIHPDTLMPAQGYLSVSVVCEHSGLADALSTALFCLPQAEGEALIRDMEGVAALWVDEAGNKVASTGWKLYEK